MRPIAMLDVLLSCAQGYKSLIYDELTKRIAAMVTAGEPDAQASALRLVLGMARDFGRAPQQPWVDEQVG
jgi:hypothetical protein